MLVDSLLTYVQIAIICSVHHRTVVKEIVSPPVVRSINVQDVRVTGKLIPSHALAKHSDYTVCLVHLLMVF